MKRSLLIFVLLMSWIGAMAQDGLKINRMFSQENAADPTVTMTMMNGENRYLRSHHLTAMATFRGSAEKFAATVAPLVLADGKRAVARNVRYRKGQLGYAFFALPKIKVDGNEVSRYIYYCNTGPGPKGRVTLVYFEGPISQARASRLIGSFGR